MREPQLLRWPRCAGRAPLHARRAPLRALPPRRP
jgi:hypothetical protein